LDLISPRALRKAQKRFSTAKVVEVLNFLRKNSLLSKGDSRAEVLFRLDQRKSGLQKKLAEDRLGRGGFTQELNFHRLCEEIVDVLTEDSREDLDLLEFLVGEINGVSEPATVPHQTLEARVTPSFTEGEDVKAK
jgi:hypothetical protein